MVAPAQRDELFGLMRSAPISAMTDHYRPYGSTELPDDDPLHITRRMHP